MKEIDDWMTPDELSRDLWGKYPKYQLEVNAAWLTIVFNKLELGGIWGWMEAKRAFRKVSDTHFVELGESE
jgi:hypothetical protein